MILRLKLLLLLVLVVDVGYSKWTEYFTSEEKIEESRNMCLPVNTKNKDIYCGSTLVEAVNYHDIYNDSKTLVDRPLKYSPNIILDSFEKQFGKLNISEMDPDKLHAFVEENFLPFSSELDDCIPVDWTEDPPEIMKIQDPTFKQWALELNDIWKKLCKQIKGNIKFDLDKHSIIWVDEPFIVPGGRFQEFYYWDTYWIIKGLLISKMYDTAKGMARNLASMVKRFGFVPNGGRIYYNRSQPPMLAPIVYVIYEATDDFNFLEEMLPLLEKEFQFWEKHRKFEITSPAGNKREVYFYRTNTFAPRPESMRADLSASKNMNREEQKQFFQSIASAAESGWDFSSRWLADRKTLATIETANIAPIDLNSYMCYNMDVLHYLNEVAGNYSRANYYEDMHIKFKHVHDEVFYNRTEGAWYDFNTRTSSHIVHNYPSIATPLFTDCYDRLDDKKPQKLFALMEEKGFFNFSGGIPTSMLNTSQQWDFPNGWAPLQHMIIEGLRKSNDPIMQDKAFELAKKWIHGNFNAYNATKMMFEKYNVVNVNHAGHGGEYVVQTGFGWTNGIILDLLHTYYDRMVTTPSMPAKERPNYTIRKRDRNGLILPAFAALNILFTMI